MNEALLVVGHGSRDPEGVDEFLDLGRLIVERRGARRTAFAFLEFAQPTVDEAIDRLVQTGADRIVCLPGMLFAAGHVKVDLPRILQEARRRWPEVEFCLCGALETPNELLRLCKLRWEEAVGTRPIQKTMLLLAGRGSSDPDANWGLESLAIRLGREYGVPRAGACYSGLAEPLVPEALESAVATDCQRIVVQPYFLFTGVLVKQIHGQIAQVAARNPGKEMFATGHLGVHSLLAEAFLANSHR
jgi:sirohydrochlorin ferrochelatase